LITEKTGGKKNGENIFRKQMDMGDEHLFGKNRLRGVLRNVRRKDFPGCSGKAVSGSVSGLLKNP
jgi:hypothetical protein